MGSGVPVGGGGGSGRWSGWVEKVRGGPELDGVVLVLFVAEEHGGEGGEEGRGATAAVAASLVVVMRSGAAIGLIGKGYEKFGGLEWVLAVLAALLTLLEEMTEVAMVEECVDRVKHILGMVG